MRPTGIISVGSRSRPLLVESLARRIGGIGRLPYLGSVPHQGASRLAGQVNSAQRLKTVWGTFVVTEDLSGLLAGQYAGEPLLLVDDYTSSGWTITVVARLLRQSGAGQVLPLVLGVDG